MDRAAVLERLKGREAELRQLGVDRLSLFGSTARGDQRTDSDVDLAAVLDPAKRVGLFGYVEISGRIEEALGVRIDLVTEPNRNPRLQAQIERDRVHVF